MPSSAREGYIGLAKQTSKGTAVAPSKFVKWQGATGMSAKQTITVYREGGDSYEPGIALKETHKPDGNFALLARPDIAGFLYALLLGADAVAGMGPYTHTITPASSLPWVSIERQIGGIQERLVDCRIKSITAEGEAGKPIKLTVEYVGINEDASVTAATATYETDMPFVFYQGTYTWDGTASAKVERFRLTVTNNFDEEHFTKNVYREDIPLLSRDVEFEATISMEDTMAFYKKVYLGSSTTPGTAAPTGSFVVDLTYGSGADQRGLKLDVPKLFYTEAPVELNSDDERLRYEIRALGGKESGSALVTVTAVTNTSAAYV